MKIPSDYYNSKEGIFISKTIQFTFGRQQAYLIQFILDRFEKAIINNQLINGFVFIPNKELQEATGYHHNSSKMRYIIKCYQEKEKWNFLEIQSFGAEDGKFYKINLNVLFKKIIPEFKANYKKTLALSRFGNPQQEEENGDNKQ